MRLTALLLLLLYPALLLAAPLRVAVAANFKPTLVAITDAFQARTGIAVSLSSASTGILATQIEHGAPFDLFFAADRETPLNLIEKLARDGTSAWCYARGSLALAGGDGSLAGLTLPGQSVAIANPATAPYGRAALEVLSRPQFQSGRERKLVRGNNVAQAYQFWQSGAVDLALLPRALAPATATPIPQTWHQPLEQYVAVLTHNAEVDAYLKWMRSDTVRALIIDAGYEPCH